MSAEQGPRPAGEGPARLRRPLGPADDGQDPFHEVVPAWTLVAIVAGITVLTGSLLVIALVTIAAMAWVFVSDERPRPPRRKRGGS